MMAADTSPQSVENWAHSTVERMAAESGDPGGCQVWSHVKWATGLASKVHDTEDTTGFLIGEVYNTLPHLVRELIHTRPRTTYNELSATMLALDTSDLKEATADYSCDEKTGWLMHVPASPTKAICEALVNMHLQTPQRLYDACYGTGKYISKL